LREQRSRSTDLYLKVPLHREIRNFGTVALESSIENWIGLILTTRPGSFRYDPQFGCRIWDQEFRYVKMGRFKEEVQKAVQEAVERYEDRLKQVKVEVTLSGLRGDTPVVVEVSVTGTIQATGERFERIYEVDWDRARRSTSSRMGAL